jgi:hypothetical protein
MRTLELLQEEKTTNLNGLYDSDSDNENERSNDVQLLRL